MGRPDRVASGFINRVVRFYQCVCCFLDNHIVNDLYTMFFLVLKFFFNQAQEMLPSTSSDVTGEEEEPYHFCFGICGKPGKDLFI